MFHIKKLYLALFVLYFFSACNKNEFTNGIVDNKDDIKTHRSDKQSPEGSLYSVTPEMLDCYLHYFTDNRVVDLIKTLADNHDTLAYYVQYANNKGWDIISADCRMAPVLSSSTKGSLSDENMTAVIVNGGLQAIKEIRREKQKNYNGIWAFVNGSIKDKKLKGHAKTKGERGLVTGMWIAQDTSIVHNTDSITHLIETEWHQKDPWRNATPIRDGNSGVVGCGPVAVAQVVYKYLHNNPGNHVIPTTFTRSHNNDSVSFSNESNSAWNNMAKLVNDVDYHRNLQTCIFLSWMGKEMNATYLKDCTIVYDNEIRSKLSEYLLYREGQDVNGSYNKRKMFRDTVLHSLNQGSPVLLSTNVSSNDAGHVFIIDAYQIETTERVIRYVFDAFHVVTDDEYYSLPSWMFDWPSMGQFPNFDPGKEGSAEMEDRQELNYSEYIKMNFGLSRDDDHYVDTSQRYLIHYRSTYYGDGGSSFSEDYPLHSWSFQNLTYYHVNFWFHHFSR